MKAVITLAAVAIVGCGKPSEPAAPKAAVDKAVSGLSSRCGVALELRASGGDPRALDAQALGDARRLTATAHALPKATYLGQSMTRLLATEASAMRECGLTQTATRLTGAR